MVGLLRAELLKIARRGLIGWLAAALAAVTLLRGLVFPPDPDVPWVGLWSATLVTVAVIILAAVTAGQEFAGGTFRSLAGRGVVRWQLLAAQWLALALVGGGLLILAEGLVVLLDIRPVFPWGEVARACLALWPYVSLITLLAVLTRSGGLPLILGVMLLGLESFYGMLLGFVAILPPLPGVWGLFNAEGLAGQLYRWGLSYNAANWTYAADPQRAPTPANLLLLVMPSSPASSALVLAAYTILGLGLSILIVYRRELTEIVPGREHLPLLSSLSSLFSGRSAGKRGDSPQPTTVQARPTGRARPQTLPKWTGRGSLLVRLAYAHLFRLARTSLVKIGAGVALLFPLILWITAKSLDDTAFLFRPRGEAGAPLAIVVCLLLIGPLATVISILAVGNDLTFGTRRAELARGVTRSQAIIAQSLALVLILGVLFAGLMIVVLLLSAAVAGLYPLGSAALTVLAGALASVTYVGVAQVGAALTRSSLGAMLAGLGFLLVDWLAIIVPATTAKPGGLLDLSRYAVTASAYSLAGGGRMLDMSTAPEPSSKLVVWLLLLGGALVSHALAILIASRRDA